MPYIEIKTRKYIDATLTQEIIDKQKEYQNATYKLRKLQQLRTCIEDENYQLLQRA